MQRFEGILERNRGAAALTVEQTDLRRSRGAKNISGEVCGVHFAAYANFPVGMRHIVPSGIIGKDYPPAPMKDESVHRPADEGDGVGSEHIDVRPFRVERAQDYDVGRVTAENGDAVAQGTVGQGHLKDIARLELNVLRFLSRFGHGLVPETKLADFSNVRKGPS